MPVSKLVNSGFPVSLWRPKPATGTTSQAVLSFPGGTPPGMGGSEALVRFTLAAGFLMELLYDIERKGVWDREGREFQVLVRSEFRGASPGGPLHDVVVTAGFDLSTDDERVTVTTIWRTDVPDLVRLKREGEPDCVHMLAETVFLRDALIDMIAMDAGFEEGV